jgi:sugar lactone lactonase YvrE
MRKVPRSQMTWLAPSYPRAGRGIAVATGLLSGLASCFGPTSNPAADGLPDASIPGAALDAGTGSDANLVPEDSSVPATDATVPATDATGPATDATGAESGGEAGDAMGCAKATGAQTSGSAMDAGCIATVLASPISLYGGKAAGLTLDATGNLYVAENVNNLGIQPDGPFVSKVTPQGVKTIFAGKGLFGGVTALRFDSNGYLYVADGIGNRYNALPAPRNVVWKVDPTGNASQFATGINNPTGLAFDRGGNLYVASFDDQAVYKFSSTGVSLGAFVTQLPFGPYGMVVDDSGNVFITGFGTSTPSEGTQVYKAAPDGGISVFLDATPLHSPADLALDSAGNLYASYYDSLKILRIAPDGSYIVFPGGCSGDDAPNGLALDPQSGVLYTALNGGRTTPSPAVVKITGIVPGGCN